MAVEEWLGITESVLKVADENDDELTANLNAVLEKNYKKLAKDMLNLYNRLEDADPKFIQVELSKLKQSKIALQILNPKELDRYEKEFEELMEQQSALGVTYGDLMTQALSNPPELVEQFGAINIDAAKIALQARTRLKNQTKDAAKDVKKAVADNLLRGGSNFQLAKDIQGRLGTSKAQSATIARTESTNVLNESSRQRYQQYGAEFLQLIALVDQRTTPWCRYRHLKIIRITESLPSYHYNCRTTTASVDPDWISTDDLKWMQEERKRVNELPGTQLSTKAPFDKKKPVFRTPNQFVKGKAIAPTQPPRPTSTPKNINSLLSRRLSLEEDEVTTITKLPRHEQLQNRGKAFLDDVLKGGDYTEETTKAITRELKKRGKAYLARKGRKVEDYVRFDKGSDKDFKKLSKDDQQTITDLTQEFLELTGGFPPVKIRFIEDKTTNRQYHRSAVGKNGVAVINVGDFIIKGTVWHELGHEFENSLGIELIAADWVKSRATGKEQTLNKLVGKKVYGRNEKAYPGPFANPYVGKIYKDIFDDKKIRATEVLSTGIESFGNVFNDGVRQLFEEDRAQLEFTLGVLLENTQ